MLDDNNKLLLSLLLIVKIYLLRLIYYKIKVSKKITKDKAKEMKRKIKIKKKKKKKKKERGKVTWTRNRCVQGACIHIFLKHPATILPGSLDNITPFFSPI